MDIGKSLLTKAMAKHHLVGFDPAGDHDNPREWPSHYKWFVVLLLAFQAFATTCTCIGIVPIAGQVVQELGGHKDKSQATLFVTIWELGEAAGPLVIAPFSEVWGRYRVFNVANVFFILGIVITALSQDVQLLIFSRFLTGCAVAANVLNPSIVADVFPSEARGSPMSLIMLAPLLGGAIGPSVAGIIAEKAGWRTIMWTCVGIAIICELAFLFFFRETYKVSILKRRAARLRRETGDDSYKTEFDVDGDSSLSIITTSMLRPAKMFANSFVLQAISVWSGMVFSFFYVMSTTLPDVLKDGYGLSSALVGVSFLSFTVGSMTAVFICNSSVDRIYNRMSASRGNKPYPEGRLPLPIICAVLLPLLIALYGWSAALHWPLWVVLSSIVFMGCVVLLGMVPAYTYITDAFGLYSASALTAALIVRCLAGTFVPLLTAPLEKHVGYGMAFTVFAVAMLLLAPIPPLMMRYGEVWRKRSVYTQEQ